MPKTRAEITKDYRERHPDKIVDYKLKVKLDGTFNAYRRNYRLHTLIGWSKYTIEKLKCKTNQWIVTINDEIIQDLWCRQKGRCAITGLRLNLEAPKWHPTRPSLDRIDCKKGYHRDNIRLVWSWVNISRGSWSDKTFKKLCQIISRTIPCGN